MKDDIAGILDQAVAKARAAGREVAGWTIQAGTEGYTAWLYGEDDDHQWCLFDEVEILNTAEAAAQWCLVQVSSE